MKKLIFIFCFFTSNAYSGGTLSLEGKLRNFDSSVVEIDDGKKIYVLNKMKLPNHFLDSIKNLKTGSKIKAAVGFDAITDVRNSDK